MHVLAKQDFSFAVFVSECTAALIVKLRIRVKSDGDLGQLSRTSGLVVNLISACLLAMSASLQLGEKSRSCVNHCVKDLGGQFSSICESVRFSEQVEGGERRRWLTGDHPCPALTGQHAHIWSLTAHFG